MKVGDLVHTINPEIHGNHGIIVEWRPSHETVSGHFLSLTQKSIGRCMTNQIGLEQTICA